LPRAHDLPRRPRRRSLAYRARSRERSNRSDRHERVGGGRSDAALGRLGARRGVRRRRRGGPFAGGSWRLLMHYSDR
jgi:hypothetical protein